MAVTSSIPVKYLRSLIYFAAAMIAEQEERFEVKQYFENEGFKKLAQQSAADDSIPNDMRISRVRYLG